MTPFQSMSAPQLFAKFGRGEHETLLDCILALLLFTVCKKLWDILWRRVRHSFLQLVNVRTSLADTFHLTRREGIRKVNRGWSSGELFSTILLFNLSIPTSYSCPLSVSDLAKKKRSVKNVLLLLDGVYPLYRLIEEIR